MKNSSQLLSALAMVLAISASGSVYAEYTMTCRGGAPAMLKFFPYEKKGMQNTKIEFTFSKGKKSLGDGELPKGTCTWVDRGLRRTEPNKMKINFNGAVITPILENKPRSSVVSVSFSSVRGEYPNSRYKLTNLIKAFQQGTTFTVKVKNKDNKYFSARDLKF